MLPAGATFFCVQPVPPLVLCKMVASAPTAHTSLALDPHTPFRSSETPLVPPFQMAPLLLV